MKVGDGEQIYEKEINRKPAIAFLEIVGSDFQSTMYHLLCLCQKHNNSSFSIFTNCLYPPISHPIPGFRLISFPWGEMEDPAPAWTLGTAYTCQLCGKVFWFSYLHVLSHQAVLGLDLFCEHLKVGHFTSYKAYRSHHFNAHPSFTAGSTRSWFSTGGF